MPEFKKLRLEPSADGAVIRLVMANGKGNILDRELMKELTTSVQRVGADSAVKAIVFEGDGAHFSFGASVPEHQKDQVAGMLYAFHTLFREIAAAARPTFALVRGQCLGGGMELACFCNLIFAAADSKFGQPEINLAVFPPIASLVLPWLVGQSASDDLLLSGRSITAEEAHTMGMVHSVAEDPEKELNAYLEKYILPKSTTALSFGVVAGRFQMYKAVLNDIEKLEDLYLNELMATHDANEGINAFIEKRKPDFRNE